jgi:nucleotide-binding universal stress UspA family protein
MFRHILVPTDGSELSLAAARKAMAFATEVKAKLTFLHALPSPPQTFFGGEGTLVNQMPPEEFLAQAEAQANVLLDELVSRAAGAGITSDKVVASNGAPYEAIIEVATARGCDLIMMASHGYRGFKGLILGSETQKVLTHSKIPVLVYR